MDFSIYYQIAVCALLSGMVGLEREQKAQKFRLGAFAGLRTTVLIGLLGLSATYLAKQVELVFPIITIFFLSLILISYFNSSRQTKDYGATSEIASVLVYVIGIFSALSQFLLATVLAMGMVLILHFRDILHRWAKHLENRELISAIQFVIVAFVILPLLPNKGFGPYEFFNPYMLWLMVVLISGISFASYILMKIFGEKRGLIFTGFLGGLVSSTALSLNFANQSRKNQKLVMPYVVGALVACSALFFRVIVEVFVVSRELAIAILVPLLTMGIVGFLIVIGLTFFDGKYLKKNAAELGKSSLKNPFNLYDALKFGFVFALILFFVKFFQDFFGDKGVYITSAVSGIIDVDAIALSMANLVQSDNSKISLGVNAITIATMVNTISKAGIFMIFGGKKVALRILLIFLIILLFGVISLFFAR